MPDLHSAASALAVVEVDPGAEEALVALPTGSEAERPTPGKHLQGNPNRDQAPFLFRPPSGVVSMQCQVSSEIEPSPLPNQNRIESARAAYGRSAVCRAAMPEFAGCRSEKRFAVYSAAQRSAVGSIANRYAVCCTALRRFAVGQLFALEVAQNSSRGPFRNPFENSDNAYSFAAKLHSHTSIL